MSQLSYMDKLLDGVEIEWKTLADVTLPTSNIKWRDIDHTHRYIDLSSVSIETKKIIETSEVDATNAPSRAQKIVQEGDVIFATTRPTQMRYCLIDDIYSGQIASTGYCVLRPQISKVLPKWILYCIASKRFKSHVENNESGAAYPAISDTKIKAFEIPVPPLNIQAEIIQILDTFTELTAELTAELVARKQQYAYYRDQLMNIDVNSAGVKQMSLGEIYHFQYGKGNTIPKTGGEYPVYGSNGIVGSHHQYNSEDAPVIGHIGAYAGIVNWGKGKHFVTYNGVICRIKSEEVLSQYAYYILLLQNFGEKSNSASQPFVSYHILEAPVVPIPSLDEQQRIVAILDKFEALTTSLTEGLPREIELRQQQYEYYRELLLSFPKTEVADHD